MNLPRPFSVDLGVRAGLTAGMRFQVAALAVMLMVCAGCAGKKRTTPEFGPARTASTGQTNLALATRPIITPDTGVAGKVVAFNATGRFAVVNFPVGHLPAADQHLFVYRQGLKVGELRADKMQMGENAVADLLTGEAQAGDEVRDK